MVVVSRDHADARIPNSSDHALRDRHHAQTTSDRFGIVPGGDDSSGCRAERLQQGNAFPQGFVALFNGKDFSGWHGLKTMDPREFESLSADAKAKELADGATDLKKHWRVEDGVIVNDGQGAYLTTDNGYGDIELLVDFKIGPKGDSGVYLRGTPQVQIWDFTEPRYARMGADKGSGGLWNNSPARLAKIRSRVPITLSTSGTLSASSRWERGPRSI